jgi:chromosome partitioning protein
MGVAMGSIVTIAQSKGGAGKTALAAILAPNLAALGYQVAVVDSDGNQSFADWHQNAYDGPAFECASEIDHIRVVDLAGELAERCDIVIVDTAGFGNLTAASAMGMADFVLIPCMPDRGSLREAIRTAQQAASLAKAARRSIRYSLIRTRWVPTGKAERAVLEMIQEQGLPMMAQWLSNLAAFSQISLSGSVPLSGSVGTQADRLIEELITIGIIPPKGSSPNRRAIPPTLTSEAA